jgi:hypothetical protein
MSPHSKSTYNEYYLTFSRSDQRRTELKLPFRSQLVLDLFSEKLVLKNGKVAPTVFKDPAILVLKISVVLETGREI